MTLFDQPNGPTALLKVKENYILLGSALRPQTQGFVRENVWKNSQRQNISATRKSGQECYAVWKHLLQGPVLEYGSLTALLLATLLLACTAPVT
jgi:hypothetical protein